MSLFHRLQTLAKATGNQAVRDFTAYTLSENCLGHVDGIAICDMTIRQTAPDAFLKRTEEALALIKSFDSRRYRRICRHLKYIANAELTSGGNFDRKLNICRVDFDKGFTSPNHEWNLRRYACLIIHEATHGVLEEKLILYMGDKRERIEDLCHLEEYRFAKRFADDWADTYLGPYDPEWHKSHWASTPGERLGAYWKRLTEKRPPV